MSTVEIHFDGGCGRFGYYSYEIIGPDFTHKTSRVVLPGFQTCNTAEYEALLNALLWLDQNKPCTGDRIEIFSDSMLVVEQMSGRWKIKKTTIKQLADRCHNLLNRICQDNFQFNWNPRIKNVARFGH
jgi:ribonuclease HI